MPYAQSQWVISPAALLTRRLLPLPPSARSAESAQTLQRSTLCVPSWLNSSKASINPTAAAACSACWPLSKVTACGRNGLLRSEASAHSRCGGRQRADSMLRRTGSFDQRIDELAGFGIGRLDLQELFASLRVKRKMRPSAVPRTRASLHIKVFMGASRRVGRKAVRRCVLLVPNSCALRSLRVVGALRGGPERVAGQLSGELLLG